MRQPRAAPLSLAQFDNNTAKEWASGAYQYEIEATILERDTLRDLAAAAVGLAKMCAPFPGRPEALGLNRREKTALVLLQWAKDLGIE